MLHDLLAILLGLITGATMAVAVSSVWLVLLIPARIQDRFRLSSSRVMTWALCLGLILSALRCGLSFSLRLPAVLGSAALIFCGMFVGMLSAALGEILEAAPVLMRRFRLGNVSLAVRWAILMGKALGAVIATLVFTL